MRCVGAASALNPPYDVLLDASGERLTLLASALAPGRDERFEAGSFWIGGDGAMARLVTAGGARTLTALEPPPSEPWADAVVLDHLRVVVDVDGTRAIDASGANAWQREERALALAVSPNAQYVAAVLGSDPSPTPTGFVCALWDAAGRDVRAPVPCHGPSRLAVRDDGATASFLTTRLAPDVLLVIDRTGAARRGELAAVIGGHVLAGDPWVLVGDDALALVSDDGSISRRAAFPSGFSARAGRAEPDGFSLAAVRGGDELCVVRFDRDLHETARTCRSLLDFFPTR